MILLLQEVAAMASSGRSLVSGLAGLDDPELGQLGRATGVVRARLERGEPASQAIASLSETYQTPIRIAMEVMAATGSTAPVYETIRLIRQRSEERRQFGFSAINPILNVIVAATVLFFIMPWIMVSISEAELIKSAFAPSVTEICEMFAMNFAIASLASVLAIGLFTAAVVWALSRTTGANDPLGAYAVFCRWLAMQSQFECGVETGRAIESAAEAVSPAFASSWAAAVRNIQGGSQTAAAIAMPAETPERLQQCVVDLVASRRDRELISRDLKGLGDLYLQTSQHRRAWWVDSLPRWIGAFVVIVVIMMLLQAIIAPLLDIVGEVAQ
ncbi:type II secretion system F family protein [Neorhodopirellula lusitana]|nr:type II secretion system F family protein [Neorhodopirellula lusitana]